MKKIIGLLLLLTVCFSCSSDDDNSQSPIEADKTAANLVTGIVLRADEFSVPIVLGNPNQLVNNSTVYPNPAPEALTVVDNSNTGFEKFWIIEANEEKVFQETDFEAILNSGLYSETELNLLSVQDGGNLSSSNLVINLNDLQEGYYRIFIKIDNVIEWHNIYKGAPEIDDLMNFWNN